MGELFERANELLGYDLRKICLDGPMERLTEPEICQPALYVVGYGAFRTLESLGLLEELSLCGGFSLGEWTALAAAAAVTFELGLEAVAIRASYMAEAGAKTPGAMAAIIGAEMEAVEKLCDICSVFPANVNAPDQIVIAGEVEKIREAIARAKEFGARRAIRLQVSGAYHCPLMNPAGEKFAKYISSIAIDNPRVPILSNVSGEAVSRGRAIKNLLPQQITSPVQWTKCMQTAGALKIDKFVECGAGSVLQGFVRKNLPHASAISAEDALEAVVAS